MINKIDKKFLYTALALVFIGFGIFFSAAMGDLGDKAFFFKNIIKQAGLLFIGIIVMLFIIDSKSVNSKFIRKWSVFIFAGTFLFELMVFAPVIGRTIKGASRWVSAGPIGTLQPSEFLKIGFILFFASLVLVYRKSLSNFWFLAIFIGLNLFPIFLVFFKAKDWGTMITIFVSAFAVLFIQETVKKKHFFFIVIVGSILMGSLAYFASAHARERIDTFLGFNNDARVESYQVVQGINAIGSGGLAGRGFGKSLQKLNGTVPEPLNDSIFTIFSEEWGFIGSTFLLSLYVLLTFLGVNIAKKINDKYAQSVVIGLLVVLLFPVFWNIGSVLGVAPFSGITLTFVSKGGSSLMASLAIVGIILSFSKYRKRSAVIKNR